MNIYIKYGDNNKQLIRIKNYESINSIINNYLIKNNINDNEIDDYFLDYNGKYLNKNFSIEKYNLKEETILTINKKKKGGSAFLILQIKIHI